MGGQGSIIVQGSAQLTDKEHNSSDRVGKKMSDVAVPVSIHTCQHHWWLIRFFAQPCRKPNLCADERMQTQMHSQSHTAFLFTNL